MLFIPFQKFITDLSEFSYNLMPGANTNVVNKSIYVPITLNFLVIILSLFTIFQYKKRVIQYKLANICMLLNVFIIGFFFLMDYTTEGFTGAISFQIGAFLPIIGAVFAFLAAHFIKKDEQLVRSADRIR